MSDVFTQALDILRDRADTALNRGMRASLTFAAADHADPDPDWSCPGGDKCQAEDTARKIVADEL